ncbi:MAG: HutD family protein [Rubrivivax sp.]
MHHCTALSEILPQPWRNGGGVTRELLVWPPDGRSGAGWRLRLSVADIEVDGPFSAFPGVWRSFVVLSGAGVVLAFDPHAPQRLTPHDAPFEFDGAAPPHCCLIDGPTRDLNLMCRDATDAGLAVAVPGAGWNDPRPWRALYTDVAARLQTASGAEQSLPAGTLVTGLPPGPLAWQPDATSLPAGRACWIGADLR